MIIYLLEFLLHLVLLEVLPPLLVGLLQILGRGLDQPPQVLLLERRVVELHVARDLDGVPVTTNTLNN